VVRRHESFREGDLAGLHGYGQKLWCNKGGTRLVDGSTSWLALDAGANPPDVFMEEGAFAVMWGPWSVQFFQESEWKRQVDTMAALRTPKPRCSATRSSRWTKPGRTTTAVRSPSGRPLVLAGILPPRQERRGQRLLQFPRGDSDYNKIIWYDEYDKIDLGKALGSYTVTTIGGVNVYSREFEKGYVYVNPTPNNVASVTLPQASRQLTHGNLLSVLDSLPIVNAISLSGFNAAILLKNGCCSSGRYHPPLDPGRTFRLRRLFFTDQSVLERVDRQRGGHRLPRLPRRHPARHSGSGNGISNTGLTPSTSFSYTVLAIDAAGNASAQSAPASATTQAAPDVTDPPMKL